MKGSGLSAVICHQSRLRGRQTSMNMQSPQRKAPVSWQIQTQDPPASPLFHPKHTMSLYQSRSCNGNYFDAQSRSPPPRETQLTASVNFVKKKKRKKKGHNLKTISSNCWTYKRVKRKVKWYNCIHLLSFAYSNIL